MERSEANRKFMESGNLGRRTVFWCVHAGARQPESLCADGKISLVVSVLEISFLRWLTGRSADFQNRIRPDSFRASVLVIGNRLGLQISKPDDKHVNVSGKFCVIESSTK
jgi:hypothetical protein